MSALGTLVIALAIAFGLLSIAFVPFTFIFYPFMGFAYSLYLWKWKAILVHSVAFLFIAIFPGLFWIWAGVLFILGLIWLIGFVLTFV